MLEIIRVWKFSRLQNKVIDKLFQLNAIGSTDNLDKKGITPSALAQKRGETEGFMKNRLLEELPQLVELRLLRVKEIEKQKQENWRYYGLSDIGYLYAIKLKLEEYDNSLQQKKISKNEYDELTRDLLSRLRDLLPMIVGNREEFERFGDVFFFSLKQSMLSFDFEIRTEPYLPFRILVLKSSLPKKSGFGINVIEQWFPLFDSKKEQSSLLEFYRDEGLDFSNVGIVDPTPIKNKMEEFSEKIGTDIEKNIELNMTNNISFMTFYYVYQNIHVVLNSLREIKKRFGKNKKYDLKKLSEFKEEFIKSGNNMLTALGEIEDSLTIDDVIINLEEYENKISSFISKKKKMLLEIQNGLFSTSENGLILNK